MINVERLQKGPLLILRASATTAIRLLKFAKIGRPGSQPSSKIFPAQKREGQNAMMSKKDATRKSEHLSNGICRPSASMETQTKTTRQATLLSFHGWSLLPRPLNQTATFNHHVKDSLLKIHSTKKNTLLYFGVPCSSKHNNHGPGNFE